MTVLPTPKNTHLSAPAYWLRVWRAAFIFVFALAGIQAKAQPCLIPILGNSIEIKPATCTGTVATLKGSIPLGGTGVYSYQWEKSVGNCSAGNFLPIPGATARDYAVPQITDPNDCFRRTVNSGTCTSVSNSTKVAAADRTTPVGPTGITVASTCAAGTGTITITSPVPEAGISYSLDGLTYTNTTGIFTALVPGAYTPTAKFITGCVSPAGLLTVTGVPAVSGSISPASASFCAGGSQVLTVNGGTSYQWYRNGTVIIGATASTFTATTAGTYTADIIVGVCRVSASNNSVITVTPLPTGTISPANVTLCSGNSQTLTATGGGTYQWSKDGSPIPGATSSTYAVNQPGIYSVIITTGGCSGPASNTATVTQGVVPSGFISPASASLCPGKSVLLTAVTANGGYTFQWYFNANPIPGATSPTYTASQIGSYNVLFFNGSCSATSLNIAGITESAPITFTATPVSPGCTITTGSINITGVAGGGANSYLYSRDNGTTFQAASSFTNLSIGTYQVVVKDTAGCISNPRSVVIQPFTSSLSATVSKTDARCGQPNGSVTVQPTGGSPGYTYSLNNNAYQASNLFNNLPAGNHQVTVKDGAGCTFSVSFAITQTGVVPNLVVTNPPNICPGFTSSLMAISITAGSDANLSYTYWLDTAATNLLPNPGAVTAGTYFIKATNSNGCATIKPVRVSLFPTSTGNVAISGPPTACNGAPVTLLASPGTGYQWYRNDTILIGATAQSYKATVSGAYTVFINSGNCYVRATETIRLQFQDCPIKVFVPTAFTPDDGSTLNNLLRPILYNATKLVYFKVFNRWGKLLYQTTEAGQGWDGRLSGVRQPSETYSWILQCTDNNGTVIKQSGRTYLIR